MSEPTPTPQRDGAGTPITSADYSTLVRITLAINTILLLMILVIAVATYAAVQRQVPPPPPDINASYTWSN